MISNVPSEQVTAKENLLGPLKCTVCTSSCQGECSWSSQMYRLYKFLPRRMFLVLSNVPSVQATAKENVLGPLKCTFCTSYCQGECSWSSQMYRLYKFLPRRMFLVLSNVPSVQATAKENVLGPLKCTFCTSYCQGECSWSSQMYLLYKLLPRRMFLVLSNVPSVQATAKENVLGPLKCTFCTSYCQGECSWTSNMYHACCKSKKPYLHDIL
ncbi:hypothetical protein ACJMK2_031997 [Sinanodonta woodiana]|uniref:Uncharacterized protein n=1 Tax=Sinanodonta woodiana TaxID=1069815 RepID=A0ABD3X0H5_SINWO